MLLSIISIDYLYFMFQNRSSSIDLEVVELYHTLNTPEAVALDQRENYTQLLSRAKQIYNTDM